MATRLTRQGVLDGVLGVAVGVVMVAMMFGGRRGGRPRHGDDWLSPGRLATLDLPLQMLLVAGAGACLVAIAVRRTWPVASWVGVCVGAGMYLFAGGQLPAAVVAMGLVAFTSVKRVPLTSLWQGVLIVPAVWAKYWTQPWLGIGEPWTWVSVLSAAAWIVMPAAIWFAVSGRRAALAQRRADELTQAALDERLRVARDIHDVVGHSLSLIALQSGVALRVLDANPAQARASLEAIRSASTTSMDELRRTLATFRETGGAALAPTPGLADVASLVAAVEATGRTISLVGPPNRPISQAVQLVAHRVAQEGLTNAVRHAPGAAIEVVLEASDRWLVVRVADDGAPVGPIKEGHGLLGMRERVASVAGELSVRPGARGVVVEARLPIGDAA